MSKLLGRAIIKVNGTVLQSLDGASIDLGGVKRTAVNGHAYYGWTEEVAEATVECEIALSADTPLADLTSGSESTVTFEGAGRAFIVRNAVLAEPPKVTDGNPGKCSLKYFGPAAEEVK